MAYGNPKGMSGGYTVGAAGTPSMMRKVKPNAGIKTYKMMGLGAKRLPDANVHSDGRAQAKQYLKYKGTYGV